MNSKQVADEIRLLCEHYRSCRVDVETRKDAEGIREELGVLCASQCEHLSIDTPELLIALLDAYEVTGDETMLQNVLNIVSGDTEQLPLCVESVILLGMCYYYVEEEECAVRAWKMLEELKGRGEDTAKLAETEERLKELL